MEKTKLEQTNAYIENYIKIANTIEARRKELGMTLKALEKETGLCAPAISRMTSVMNKPRLDTLMKVLDALDLEIKIVRKSKKGKADDKLSYAAADSKKYNVWVKKNNHIELIKVRANSKTEARQITHESNPDWEICTIERAPAEGEDHEK